MRHPCLICGLAAAAGLLGQDPDRPSFDRDHVIPHRSTAHQLLTRGQFVTIAGSSLMPKQLCEELGVQSKPYPLEICGVRVLVGGHPAGLMYVGPIGNQFSRAHQINFQIPSDAPAERMVPILVCVGASCSDPVDVEITAKDILLRVEGNAYVHMPVWVQVEIPISRGVHYPHSSCLMDCGEYKIEVRRDGQLLTPASRPECPPRRISDNISLYHRTTKLPLHLLYQFDSPGTYEIRLTAPVYTPDLTKIDRFGRSDWTPITVEPYSVEQRDAWLREIGENANKSAGYRAADLIASLPALPDEKALATLIRFLPPPPPPIRQTRGSGNFNWVTYCWAPNALAAFSEPVLRKLISHERLMQLRVVQGGCP